MNISKDKKICNGDDQLNKCRFCGKIMELPVSHYIQHCYDFKQEMEGYRNTVINWGVDGLHKEVDSLRNEINRIHMQWGYSDNKNMVKFLHKTEDLRKCEKFVQHIYNHSDKKIHMEDWVLCKICNKTFKQITKGDNDDKN